MLYVPSFTWPVVNTLRKPDPSRSSFDYVGRINSDVRGPRDPAPGSSRPTPGSPPTS